MALACRCFWLLFLVGRAAPFSSVLRASQHRVLEGDGSTRELRKTVGEIVRKSHKREPLSVSDAEAILCALRRHGEWRRALSVVSHLESTMAGGAPSAAWARGYNAALASCA